MRASFLLAVVLGVTLILVVVLALIVLLILVLVIHSRSSKFVLAVIRFHSVPRFSGFILGLEYQTCQ